MIEIIKIADHKKKNYEGKSIAKAYLQEKNIQNPPTADELATVLLNAFCAFRALDE